MDFWKKRNIINLRFQIKKIKNKKDDRKAGEKMKKKMNKKGFTLVELLVVVSIIGILAGIVLVSLNSGRERTRKASLQSTLSSIITVANMCVNDSGTINPPAGTGTSAGGNAICSLTDITEIWPVLNVSGAAYQYIKSGPTYISAGVGTTEEVCCTIATSSCVVGACQ